MWQNAATARNLARLQADGFHVWGPASGEQACGETGPGRMLEPEELAARADVLLDGGPLQGIDVLLTAGPTQEAIDPVRYITNHSSGKQGYALARAFRQAGATVTLVSGPVHLEAPDGVDVVRVVTARDMHDAVMARLARHQIFVGVAAVADYRPETEAEQKIKKSRTGAPLNLTLTENPDIIAAVARSPARPFVVGFAAETERAVDHARDKLERKGLDLIVVNDVADRRIGFASDDNAVTVVSRAGAETLPLASKIEISRTLVGRIAERFLAARDRASSAGQCA
jgi:phosphopantothenoylcysteine decarboxylase/phosphopantothenate--cysteine ligase